MKRLLKIIKMENHASTDDDMIFPVEIWDMILFFLSKSGGAVSLIRFMGVCTTFRSLVRHNKTLSEVRGLLLLSKLHDNPLY